MRRVFLFAVDVGLQRPYQFLDEGPLMLVCQYSHGLPDILWNINRDFVVFRPLIHTGIIPSIPQYAKAASAAHP